MLSRTSNDDTLRAILERYPHVSNDYLMHLTGVRNAYTEATGAMEEQFDSDNEDDHDPPMFLVGKA